ncbi:MAG: hypothetical protein HIU82_18945, partial [Proteobacteria bacterium]|nr:hypothetical protein [Pseudomonadota bacterium]
MTFLWTRSRRDPKQALKVVGSKRRPRTEWAVKAMISVSKAGIVAALIAFL